MTHDRIDGPPPAPGDSDEDLRRAALAQREAALRAGETAIGQRESAVQAREDRSFIKDEMASIASAQLVEANERLVVATIHAQSLTEAAEAAATQMSFMAKHDGLTGLPNRALLTDRLAQAITLAQRQGNRVALAYLDLDHFKHINDSLGHAVGDALLQAVAKRLQDCVRQSDSVFRQGGDEFVVLLSQIHSVNDATLTAQKIIEATAEPYLIQHHRLHVTLSIGVTIYPDDCGDAEAMMRDADTAMYYAKKSGRNNYQMFSPEMNVRAVARQSMHNALHHALDEGGFMLQYQPKINLKDNQVLGVEALLRLVRPDRTLLHPEHFIGIAEESGLIVSIGRWVLREACTQAAAWTREGIAFGQMAVNVSAVEFHSKGFLASLQAILQETGLNPGLLELELTESGLLQHTEPTILLLQALKDMGVHISIDDFGTGYSSLSYLRRFPIDTIKIDQSFVRHIQSDNGESKLVVAIIAMGKSLNLRVLAEGIETSEQLNYLKSQGCLEGQGYFFSRPLHAKAFAAGDWSS